MGSFKPGDPAAVEALFDQIAPRYDLLNDLLSLGLHRVWKRQAVAAGVIPQRARSTPSRAIFALAMSARKPPRVITKGVANERRDCWR